MFFVKCRIVSWIVLIKLTNESALELQFRTLPNESVPGIPTGARLLRCTFCFPANSRKDSR